MGPHARVPQHLAANVMHFGRVLRHAGLPVGTDRIELALQALQEAGLHSRREFHAVLSACMVARREQQELFDQAFFLFWRDPDLARAAQAAGHLRGGAAGHREQARREGPHDVPAGRRGDGSALEP